MNEHILRLQNPSDCDKAKKIVCDLNKACGFGCQMHHVMYCFITSFFLNRTLILESSGWRYNSAGATAYFKPMSDSCTSVSSTDKVVGWNG
jgi:glycoprotein 6-alpha-L-fucosyltransferase